MSAIHPSGREQDTQARRAERTAAIALALAWLTLAALAVWRQFGG